MNLMDQAVREAAIKAYLTRCICRMKVRFLEWRLDYKLSAASD